MARGTVKWFNESKGFGFIEQDTGEDCFLHYSSVVGESHITLVEGERVEYDETSSPRGLRAENVRRIE